MPLDGQIIRLASAGVAEPLADTRVVTFVLSDSSVARDGHTVATKGWDTTAYMTNPVVLWAHDGEMLPIGKMQRIWVRGDSLMGDVEFAPGDLVPLAETVYQLVRQGYLNAVSVGFIPTEAKPANRGKGSYDIVKAELLEVSVVPVPALSTALATARAAGIDTAPMLAWARRIMETAEMPETTERAAPMKRDLYDVGWLAQLLQSLGYLADSAEWEAEMEGDESPVPGMLVDAIKQLGSVLISMTVEEVGELVGTESAEDRAVDTAGQRAVKALGRMARTKTLDLKIDAFELRAAISEAVDAVRIERAGRVISAENERCLREAHGKISDAADIVRAVFEQVDPDTDNPEGEQSDGGAETRARKAKALTLKHRTAKH